MGYVYEYAQVTVDLFCENVALVHCHSKRDKAYKAQSRNVPALIVAPSPDDLLEVKTKHHMEE